MEIENRYMNYEVLLDDVGIGECFLYRNELHMKVDIGSLKYSDISAFPNVVINLENNKLNAVRSGETVRTINSKIVIQ